MTTRHPRSLLALPLLLLHLSYASAATAACIGDCGGDGAVTVDELLLGVNIALGSAGADTCAAIDANSDRRVTVDEILSAVTAILTGCPPAPPRLVAFSRAGQVASLDTAAPWAVRTSSDLGAQVASARCRGAICVAVHPDIDSISILNAVDLSVRTLPFDRKSGLRDAVFLSDREILVSAYERAAIFRVDLDRGATTEIDLSAVADEDGLPESHRIAVCGTRAFVQLRRTNHEDGSASRLGPGLAVIDWSGAEGNELIDVDPLIDGTQAISLAGAPSFDMPADCSANRLFVAEPAPLMRGGGSYEEVDLVSLRARELPIDTGAEVGGFEFVGGPQFWLITHTTTGPGPSSHLNLIGGGNPDTHNTFADEHVNDLAYDPIEDLLYYPDPCIASERNPTCKGTGVIVFHAHSGDRASASAIDVGFPPIELAIAR